ncbi:MAG: hypothetical protein COB02_17050 [Candidatus Cloacimonadota bacterium]|nr:MAG: hypothetical protein COB02_17050 [Candidatus Cloacimonadota bacterium]
MRYIFIVLLLSYQISAIALRKNSFRGNGVVYTNIIQSDGGFEQLKNYDYKQIYYPSGKIELDGEFVRKKTITWNTDEKKWLSRFYYDHNLEYIIGKKLQNKFQKNSYEEKKTSEILIKEITYYEGKFQNIILDLSKYCDDNFNINYLRQSLKKYNKKLGLKLSIDSLKKKKNIFKSSPDFFIFEVDLYKQDDLKIHIEKLSKLNVPYYLSYTMKSQYFSNHQKVDLKSEDLEELNLISEEKHKSGAKKIYKVVSNNNSKLKKNSIIVELSPSVMILNKALDLSEKIDNFWYNGHIIHLNRWSSRLLTRNHIKYIAPSIDYLKKQTNKGLELSLSLMNPNPVGTNHYKDQAGIALKLRGYQLKSIDMSAFDNIKASNINGEKILYFTLNQMDAFSRSGTIKLHLDENGAQPNISSVAWIKLPAEIDYLYSNGDFSTRIPEYQLKHFSKSLD